MFLTGTQGSADRNPSAELSGGVVQPVEFPGAATVSFRKHLPGRIWRPQNRWTGRLRSGQVRVSVRDGFCCEKQLQEVVVLTLLFSHPPFFSSSLSLCYVVGVICALFSFLETKNILFRETLWIVFLLAVFLYGLKEEGRCLTFFQTRQKHVRNICIYVTVTPPPVFFPTGEEASGHFEAHDVEETEGRCRKKPGT